MTDGTSGRKKRPAIAVVGSLNMDLVFHTPTLPTAGQTVLGESAATFAGGKGANQAVAAARAGGRVSLIGCVGNDNYGSQLRMGLDAEGIDIAHVLVRPQAATGMAMIAVNPAGDNMIIVAPGANATLSQQDVRQAVDPIADADVLLLQLEIPLPAIVQAITIARHTETRVVLTPAPAQPLSAELLQEIDFLVPNETEAAVLGNARPTDWRTAEQVARDIARQGARSVAITLGKLGAVLWHEDQFVGQVSFAVDAVDTTAAGDAFVGAFAVALAEGRQPAEALRWGTAAGALATTHSGAQPSLPTREEIEFLLG